MNVKKALFISSLQIYPALSGGQLRSAHFCEALVAQGFEVTLYSLTGRKEDYIQRRPSFQNRVAENLVEVVNMNPFFGVLQLLSYRLDLPPLWVTELLKWYVPKKLKRLLKEADLVVLDFPFLSPLLTRVSGEAWVNTHNAEFELWKDRPRLAKVVKQLEVQCFKKTEKVIFCSPQDYQKFVYEVPMLSQKSMIVPNGLNLQKFQLLQGRRHKVRSRLQIDEAVNVFLFSGSSFGPNMNALKYIKDMVSQYSRELQSANVMIVVAGTVSEEKINTPVFKVLGRVDDMMDCLAMADFGFNPMDEGSGVNVKMIEYIASKLPIISTSVGWRGLIVENGMSGLVFERQNFLATVLKAVALSKVEREAMAVLAYKKNEMSLDMEKSVKAIFENKNHVQVTL